MDRFAKIVESIEEVAKYIETTYEVGLDFALEICNRHKEEIDGAIKLKLNCYAIGDEIADKECLNWEDDTEDYFEEAAERDDS